RRCVLLVCCFFFQAEDGIRDFHVTGVQTCALPIFWNRGDAAMLTLDGTPMPDCTVTTEVSPWDEARSRGVVFRGLGNEPFWSLRSEERRVGKEGRSGW